VQARRQRVRKEKKWRYFMQVVKRLSFRKYMA